MNRRYLTKYCKETLDGLVNSDRYDRLIRWIIVLTVTLVFPMLVCLTLRAYYVSVQFYESHTPQNDARAFSSIVGVSSTKFSNIQYQRDVATDVFHQFRFHFSRIEGLNWIIERHHLKLMIDGNGPSRLPTGSVNDPDWYDLPSASESTRRYRGVSFEFAELYVDEDSGVAYFEMLE